MHRAICSQVASLAVLIANATSAIQSIDDKLKLKDDTVMARGTADPTTVDASKKRSRT